VSDILDKLRRKKLRSVKASITYSDTRDKIIHDHATHVKAALRSGDLGDEVANSLESQLSLLYRKMWQEYYQRPLVRYPKLMSKRGIAFWHRVAVNCTTAKVSPELYMRAQFHWFHKKFGRPPEVLQLTTKNALDRVVEFLATEQNSARKVIGNDIRPNLDKAAVFRRCEKQVRDVCRAQGLSREEFYVRIVLTGAMAMPQEFLDMDPVYRKVASDE
jgi:hypothetical protein